MLNKKTFTMKKYSNRKIIKNKLQNSCKKVTQKSLKNFIKKPSNILSKKDLKKVLLQLRIGMLH